MNLIQYLESIPGLRPVARTVSAQMVSPNDNGLLRYPVFFPVENVESTKIGEITIGTYRPVASRRAWNAPGRLIPIKTPDVRDIDMLPIEAHFTVGEQEIQLLEERTDGDDAAILRRMGATVESRTDGLTEAVYRRVEYDGFQLWSNGKLVQENPQTGDTVETDFNFGSDRQQDSSGTPWSSSTFYDNMVAWLKDGVGAIGPIEGVMLSSAKFTLAKASGPTVNGKTLKRSELEDEISDELGRQFSFVQNDDTLDLFVDGGTATVNTLVWPTNKIAAIPAGGRVGITAKAPVARAGQLSRQFPNAGLDRRGVAVYYLELNEGKGAKIVAQVNMMSIPNKGKVWTNNVG